MVHCTNRQKHSKPLVYKSSQVYQDCSNSVPIVKNSQNSTKMTTKMSTKTVPTVYQQCTKNSQKTLRTAKMTIGVSTVTVLPRLYQQCNNNLQVVNKNLAIAKKSRVSCAHNTSKAFIGLNIIKGHPSHWKRNHGTDHTRLTRSRVI